MEKSRLLKWFILIGGYFEVFLGFLFMFMDVLLGSFGLSTDVPIFNQILGAMTICFGMLLIYSVRNIGTYSIIPKINCLLRFIVQPFAIYNMVVVPEMLPILIGASIYDVVWAIFVLILLKQCGYFIVKDKSD